jgi:hypothetical protein
LKDQHEESRKKDALQLETGVIHLPIQRCERGIFNIFFQKEGSESIAIWDEKLELDQSWADSYSSQCKPNIKHDGGLEPTVNDRCHPTDVTLILGCGSIPRRSLHSLGRVPSSATDLSGQIE